VWLWVGVRAVTIQLFGPIIGSLDAFCVRFALSCHDYIWFPSNFASKRVQEKDRVDRATLPPLAKPFLKCSSKVSIYVLRKFIVHKLGLTSGDQIEILCGNEIMGSEHNLRFIRKTRWFDKHRDMVLQYRLKLWDPYILGYT
jgi:hypothetical protein